MYMFKPIYFLLFPIKCFSLFEQILNSNKTLGNFPLNVVSLGVHNTEASSC